MHRRLSRHFSPAALALSVIAIILALAGGAIAANGGLTGKQKKEVKKIAKQYAGKPGAPGAAGANGKDGSNGKDGTNGAAGEDGTDGTSITGVPASVGECPAGGVKYTSASGASAVCNGEDGQTGFTVTLPPGQTETGTFYGAFNEGVVFAPVTFAIPLEAEIASDHVKTMKVGEAAKPECEVAAHAGTASAANPEAQPGYLCVFAGVDPHESAAPLVFKASGPEPTEGVSRSGAIVQAAGGENGFPYWGTFALTAP